MARVYLLLFIWCSSSSFGQQLAWRQTHRVEITDGNITFAFPDTISMAQRMGAIDQCKQAITRVLRLINEKEFSDTITIEFLSTRNEMLKYTGMAAAGMAFPERRTMFSLIGVGTSPPILHELTHMVLMLKWGSPHPSSNWMNEGMATFSENQCNGLTVSEIYRYLSEHQLLLSIDSLAADFYHTPEMIAYHESGYLVEFFLSRYGIPRFQELWRKGSSSFNAVVGQSLSDFEGEARRFNRQEHPKAPSMDWKLFLEGCM
jgi:hypothetical protein